LSYWISPGYDPFSLGGPFETYELFIYLVFQCFFFSGRGELRVIETLDTESVDKGARLYLSPITSKFQCLLHHLQGDLLKNYMLFVMLM
jgi:hypothetical protein